MVILAAANSTSRASGGKAKLGSHSNVILENSTSRASGGKAKHQDIGALLGKHSTSRASGGKAKRNVQTYTSNTDSTSRASGGKAKHSDISRLFSSFYLTCFRGEGKTSEYRIHRWLYSTSRASGGKAKPRRRSIYLPGDSTSRASGGKAKYPLLGGEGIGYSTSRASGGKAKLDQFVGALSENSTSRASGGKAKRFADDSVRSLIRVLARAWSSAELRVAATGCDFAFARPLAQQRADVLIKNMLTLWAHNFHASTINQAVRF